MSRVKYPLNKLNIDFTIEDVMSTFKLNKPRAMKLIKYWLSKKYVVRNGENYIRKDEEVAKHNVMDVTDPNPLVTEPVTQQPVEEVKEEKVEASKEAESKVDDKPTVNDIVHKHDVLYRVTLTNSTTMELKAKSIADAMKAVQRMGYPNRAIFKIEEM